MSNIFHLKLIRNCIILKINLRFRLPFSLARELQNVDDQKMEHDLMFAITV